jgi:hypothetical protein
MNGFRAVQWCISHGLLQQAVTILRESVVSFFYNKYKKHITCKRMSGRRELISAALNILAYNMPESNWRITPDLKPQLKAVVEAFRSERRAYMLTNSIGKREHISVAYDKLGSLRNDLNHNGMNDGPRSPEVIKEETVKYFDRIYKCLTAKSQR